MFGMVASTGIKILASVDYDSRRNDALIIAVSLGLGLIPIVQPQLLKALPAALQRRSRQTDRNPQSLGLRRRGRHHAKPVMNDPILLTAVVALLLNAAFNHPWEAAVAADGVTRDREG
jgi:xanthine/uracil permease